MSRPTASSSGPMLVRELMQIGVTTCTADMPLAEAVQCLLRQQLEGLVVLNEHGHAVGLLGRPEVLATFGRPGIDGQLPPGMTVAEVMRPDIPEVPPDIPAPVAAQLMLDLGVRELYLMHHSGGITWPAARLSFEMVLRHLVGE